MKLLKCKILTLLLLVSLLLNFRETTVFGEIYLEEIGYDDNLGVDIGSTLNLSSHIRPIPSSAPLTGLTYHSSNTSVATVDNATGVISGHSIGHTIITVSHPNGISEGITIPGVVDHNLFYTACSQGKYKIVLVADANGGMHWYRQEYGI